MSNKSNNGFSRGDRVLVGIQSRTGDKTLQPGEVKEVSGKGAFVALDCGPRRFFFGSQITRDATPKPVPAMSIPAVPKQSAPPHFAPKLAPAPEPTIGALFAAERVSRGLSQGVAARELGVKLAELLDFEAGVDVPSDELVLAFSEAFSVDLAPLSAALERSKQKAPPVAVAAPAPKPEPPPAVPTLPEKSELAAAPGAQEHRITRADLDAHLATVEKQLHPAATHAQAPSPPSRGVPIVGPMRGSEPDNTFEAFVERLDAVTPLPARGAHRVQWFALAKALFKLNTEIAPA